MIPADKSRRGRARLIASSLLGASLLPGALTGCAAITRAPQLEYELDATRTALDAQMDATASLEDEETRLEAAIAEAEDRARAREEAVAEVDAELAARDVEQFELVEESVAPEAEVEPEEAPPPELLSPEELLGEVTIVGEDSSPAAALQAPEPWTSAPLAGGAGGVAVVGALNNIARSLDEQKMLMIMEARLADKQRLMDYYHGAPGPVSPGVGGVEVEAPGAIAADDPLRAQVAQLAELQLQLIERLAADEAADGTESPPEELAADGEVAPSEEELAASREEERWAALMARLDAIEARAAGGADGTQGAAEVAADDGPSEVEASAGDSAELAALKAQVARLQALVESGARGGEPEAVEDPELAELKAALAALREERERAEDPELAELKAELAALREERERAGRATPTDSDAELEAMLAEQRAAIEAQSQQLSELERSRAEERQWYQRMFDRLSGAPAQAAPAVVQPPAVTVVQPEPAISNEELLAAIQALQAADGEDRDVAQSEVEERLADERAEIQADRARIQDKLEALKAEPVEDPDQARAELDALRAEMAAIRARESQAQELQAELDALKGAGAEREARIQQTVQPLIDQGLDVEIHGDRVRVLLPSDVLFASGASTLSEDGVRTVRDVAAVLEPLGVDIQIEGHTDDVPMYGGKSNWDLSYERARNVLQTMAEAGIPASLLSAAAFGDTRPIASNDTEAGRAANRRIEITLRIEDEG